MRIVVVGAGIAGLSVAALLARRGHHVTVLEQEPAPARHSSGHSAGMFRLPVPEPINVRLALRSAELAESFAPGVIERLGAWFPCADAATRRAILDASAFAGVVERPGSELPTYVADRDRPALFSPHDGVIDLPRLLAAIDSAAREAGAGLRFGVTVRALVEEGGAIVGVETGAGALPAEVVVDACGAFSKYFPGAPATGVQPHRRHVFVLPADPRIREVVWDLDTQLYLRPSAEGVLASPCDQVAQDPIRGELPVDSSIERLLREKLATFAPSLAARPVLRAWAGVRPLTRDHRFHVGWVGHPSRRLFRLGGFGGHGMTAGLAAAEIACLLLEGGTHPDAAELDPNRA